MSLYESLPQLWYNPLWLTGLEASANKLTSWFEVQTLLTVKCILVSLPQMFLISFTVVKSQYWYHWLLVMFAVDCVVTRIEPDLYMWFVEGKKLKQSWQLAFLEKIQKEKHKRLKRMLFNRTKQDSMWIFKEILLNYQQYKNNHLSFCHQFDSCRRKWAQDSMAGSAP